MKNITFLILILLLILFLGSCTRCKDCYYVECEGTSHEITTDLGKTCGEELERYESDPVQESTDCDFIFYCN
jgi:hypothetical protein